MSGSGTGGEWEADGGCWCGVLAVSAGLIFLAVRSLPTHMDGEE